MISPNDWLTSLHDPFRDALLREGIDLPETMRHLAEPLRDEPAFDPGEIDRIAEGIPLPSDAAFEHPLLERAVRVGLAHIDATFEGDHPKYGVGRYANPIHDGFPPTIIAAVDALTLWGHTERAAQLFLYWMREFVRADGSLNYYGPSLSEFGQLLTTARRLLERGGETGSLREFEPQLRNLIGWIRQRLDETGEGLLRGVPEADELEQPAAYFHNNAWIARGLYDAAFIFKEALGDAQEAERLKADADRLGSRLLAAIDVAWPGNADEAWWLRPRMEPDGKGYWARPQDQITGNRLGSYTNYRYWSELLSSGLLSKERMEQIVRARLTGGGQFLGMTRFEGHLDDWPLMDHLEGLWQLGRVQDYRICLWGHILYHQAEGHLTAYEQVSFPPGKANADYCLPCQLVAVRAARRLIA